MNVRDELCRDINLVKYVKTMDAIAIEEKPNVIVNLLQMINISEMPILE
jgi:hypothetical protein